MLRASEEAFLSIPRLGMFSTVAGEGWSRPVPVWFAWQDGAVELFSGATAPKIARLQAEPRAHLLAANNLGEPEAWLSIAGPASMHPVDPAWLEELSARYWDLGDPTARATVDGWIAAVDSMVGITVRPQDVHRYGF